MKKICISFLSIFCAVNSFASLKELNTLKTPFQLAPLPYAADSLSKAIDAETMTIHHSKHHQAYVNNANAALSGRSEMMLDLLLQASQLGPAIRNNVGGHWNHTFFWSVLSGKESDNKIPKRLLKQIEAKWESFSKFQEAFEKAGSGLFGSGWVWLVRTSNGLEITTTVNQDNPLMDLASLRGWPILGADVWEHAYYLKYQNKRADYLKGFWSVINWKQVDAYDREVLKTTLPSPKAP